MSVKLYVNKKGPLLVCLNFIRGIVYSIDGIIMILSLGFISSNLPTQWAMMSIKIKNKIRGEEI